MGNPRIVDVTALRMREATIVAGIWITFLVGALGETYVALTWSRPHRLQLTILFAVATAAGAAIAMLPRERIVRSALREPFFLAWSLLDFAMLVFATTADGGTSSPLVIVFFIPVIFSAMSYPLGSVAAVGVISVVSYFAVAVTAGGSSPEFEVSFLATLTCVAAMSAWQAQNHQRQHRALMTASRTDALTGCLNRRGFEEHAARVLESMRRSGTCGALLVLDLDHFKEVNDHYGHPAGDRLLQRVAETLVQELRPVDAVGRLGGDEFSVLFADLAPQDAHAAATRIAGHLLPRAPASLGLAIFPDHGENLEELTRMADRRLYASRSGRTAPGGLAGATPPGEAPDAGGAEAPETGSRTYGMIDLWRAALDASPTAVPAERRRPQQMNLQAALLDQIDASVIALGMDRIVLSWNSGAEALYGWTRGEALGRDIRDLVVPEDTAPVEQLAADVIRDGRRDGEVLVRHKDGSLFTAYVRNRLVLDEFGSPAAIVGVAVDVTARLAAESELIHARNYAHAITDCMGEGLFTLDVDGHVGDANAAAEAALGWRAGELIGRSITEILLPPRAGGPTWTFAECEIARALGGEGEVRNDDAVFRNREGREIPVAYTAAPFRTDDGLQGCVVVFHDVSERKHREQEQVRDAERLATINRVESALAEERLVLYAQPIVDLQSGRTVQHELLLRMREPDGRIAPPGEFLPVAEKYALIGEIDWWVLKQAARLAGAGSPVQVNLSARSVVDPDVLEHIERCLEQSAVAPGMLVFEITETAIIEDEQAARRFAERLRELGCRVALDDFGTGYGTLTYLKQIPLDYLKLDIEFVRDVVVNDASRRVVQAVVNLARDFNLETVAEGVEDAEALTLLRQLGVDRAQGYHLARPEPFEERPGDTSPPVRITAAPPHPAPARTARVA